MTHCLLFQEGKLIPNDVKVGDQVLLPEFGGTKIVIEDQVMYSIINDRHKDGFIHNSCLICQLTHVAES